MRLAWNAGRVDVDRMLAGVTPEQFDEWVAFFNIEGDPLARIREVNKMGFALLASAQGAKVEPAFFDPIKPAEADPSEHNMSPQQAIAAVGLAYGVQ